MDQKRKTALISVIGITAAIGLMVAAGFGIARSVGSGVRRVMDPAPSRSERAFEAEESGSAEGSALLPFDFEALGSFDSIKTTGGWRVTITGGERHDVDVTASERALPDVEVFTSGDVLHLELESGVRSVTGNLTATIVVPDLERLETDGGADVTLRGLDLDKFSIDVDGAASVRASDTRIQRLDINVDGAASLNFAEARVVNAQIDMDGASSLDITMDGGELSGEISGLGEVRYGGSVTNQNISVDGLGRVRER